MNNCAFEKGWAITKSRQPPREPSNIMMRRLDPVKLQEMAQRYHDNVLAQIQAGTYKAPQMRHPFPYVLDENQYREFVDAGQIDEEGYPMIDMALPFSNDEKYSRPKVSWGDQWVVQSPNGEWHYVNNEGVGGIINAQKPADMDIHLDHLRHGEDQGKVRSFGMLPMGGFQIGIDDIAGLLGTEEKPLEEVIRVFGDRLERNYMDHLRAMKAKGLGGGSGAFDQAWSQEME